MQLLKNALSFSAKEFCFVFFGYVLMFFLVQYLIYPVQEIIIPKSTIFAALIFLPHGVRVVSIWLLRERAIIPLFLASLVIYRSFYWYAEPFYLNYFLILTGTFVLISQFCFLTSAKLICLFKTSQFRIGEVLFCWVLWLQFLMR